ncbi:MAG: hypothetical protein IJP37_02745 [Clostridia bacterium]|nr:hypothetical protein [Clostridia bacterium]
MRADKLLSTIFLAVLGAGFLWWAFTAAALTVWGVLAAILILGLFAWCGLRLIPQVLNYWGGVTYSDPEPTLGARSLRWAARHPWLRILILVILSRIAIYIAAYLFDLLFHGYEGGLFDRLAAIWLRGDAPHYQGIAKNWYVTEGDPRFHIVFFPLYPLLIKLFSFLTGETFAASLLVSNLCFFGACLFLYELVLPDHGKKAALRAVKFLCILPAAHFFNAPMSESAFLLCSLACMYFLRKKKPLFAGIFGLLAAFTRSLGIMLLVPAVVEWVAELCEARRSEKEQFTKMLLIRIGCFLLILAGLGAYLYINYDVTGNAFQFMVYQKEHWSQGIGWFFNTASYQTNYAVKTFLAGDTASFLGLWLPNLLALILGLAVLLPNLRRLRASVSAYHLGYYFAAIGATWLLSGPRYLAASFPIAISLAVSGKGKAANAILTAVCILGLLAYLAAYVANYPVY